MVYFQKKITLYLSTPPPPLKWNFPLFFESFPNGHGFWVTFKVLKIMFPTLVSYQSPNQIVFTYSNHFLLILFKAILNLELDSFLSIPILHKHQDKTKILTRRRTSSIFYEPEKETTEGKL